MKREFLENAIKNLKVEDNDSVKSVVDSIMAEYGKAFKETNEKLDNITTERDTLKNQLENANKTINELKDIDVEAKDKAISEWKEKYDKDTKELQEKLTQQNYEHKIKDLASKLKFTSKGAENDFISKAYEKKLVIEGEKVLGWDDFVNSCKESDPEAFKEDTPQAVANTGGNHQGEPNGNQFNFGFTQIRQKPNNEK